MTRDERQKLSVKRWLDSNGHGTLVCATGFGFDKHPVDILILHFLK